MNKHIIDILIDFQQHLLENGLITDYDWDFEATAHAFAKKTNTVLPSDYGNRKDIIDYDAHDATIRSHVLSEVADMLKDMANKHNKVNGIK